MGSVEQMVVVGATRKERKIRPVAIPWYEQRRLQPKATGRPAFKTEIQKIARSRFEDALQQGLLSQIEVACPICKSQHAQTISHIDRSGLSVHTVLCQCCPTLYSRERLDDNSLEIFYREFYRPLYSGIVEPSKDWFQEQSLNGRRILEWIETSGFGSSSFCDKRVVDIGAGAGGCLKPFRDHGAHVLGIDYDEKFIQFGRAHGINMENGGVDELRNHGKFDLVILKDVLEHLPDPRESIRQVRQSLNVGGLCFIQVPGLQSLRYLGYRNDLLRYLQIAHLTHFTKESLALLLESEGLKVVAIDSRAWALAVHGDAAESNRVHFCDNSSAAEALRKIFFLRPLTAVEFCIRQKTPPVMKKMFRRIQQAAKYLRVFAAEQSGQRSTLRSQIH